MLNNAALKSGLALIVAADGDAGAAGAVARMMERRQTL